MTNIRYSTYTDVELLEILNRVLDEYGHDLGKNKYEVISSREGYPSSTTYRKRFGTWNKARNKAVMFKRDPKGLANYDSEVTKLQNLILREIEKGKTIVDVSNSVDRSPETVVNELQKLEDLGFSIEAIDIGDVQKIKLGKVHKPKRSVTVNTFIGGVVKLGIVSDTHLCSEAERIDLLESFYKVCKSEGIDSIYNAGDVIDGYHVYRGHDHELHVVGADKQLAYCADNYPYVEGITTYFITGNHDLCYHKTSGFDIGVSLERLRSDFVYLGPEEADVHLEVEGMKTTKPVTMRLFHPGGTGSAYALSYRAQKTIETYQSGDKPNILVIGHLHKASYFFIRNIHALQGGCMQDQTRFMRNKALEAHRGGWILECTIREDGSVNRVKCEFLSTFL